MEGEDAGNVFFLFIVFIFCTCSLGYALSSQLAPTPCLPPPSLDTRLHNHNIRCAAGRVLAQATWHHTLTARPPPFARIPNQQSGTHSASPPSPTVHDTHLSTLAYLPSQLAILVASLLPPPVVPLSTFSSPFLLAIYNGTVS